MTPVSSVAAFQASETLVADWPVERKLPGEAGACVSGSGQVAVAAVTDVCAERFPAASAASTESV